MSDRKLLVLDDEPAVGQLLCRQARRAGMQARHCLRAEEFFELLGAWRPTHVFVDLVMPGVDGVQVLAALARGGSSARIILGSGFDLRVLQSAERAARARGLAVAGILPKPFSLRTLRELLRAEPPPLEQGHAAATSPSPQAAELDRALACNEIVIAYQPKWCLRARRALGVEALVRWQHPTLGMLYPDRFIPQAEADGSIHALTEHVMSTSLAWFARIGAGSGLVLEVNVSGVSLGALSPERMAALCVESAVPVARVLLEVTETSQVADTLNAADVLNRLRLKGFGLAIDDYGVGYSSLSQLATFPFTELKIDKVFIEQLTRSADMRSIVASTIGLAHTMGLTTVAEGVEDAASISLLEEMGCDAVQGYAIARPMYASQARDWLAERGS